MTHKVLYFGDIEITVFDGGRIEIDESYGIFCEDLDSDQALELAKAIMEAVEKKQETLK